MIFNLIFKSRKAVKFTPNWQVVPEIGDQQFRELIYGNYRIIYRIEKKRLSILTIRHGKQVLPIEDILA